MKKSDAGRMNIQTHHPNHSCPQIPDRFVEEEFRKPHTDDIEALAWAFFDELIKIPDKQHLYITTAQADLNTFVIYDLILKWNNKIKHEKIKYEWVKFELITSDDEINCLLKNCYEIRSSYDILKMIVHYASVGEKDPKYIMINNWIFKLYPKKLYVFLVGKRLIRTENTDEIQTVIKNRYKNSMYKEIQEEMKRGGEKYKDLYAQFTRDTLHGVYTSGSLPPRLEAAFNMYFTATVISESVRNFRSFISLLMALDLSLNQRPEFLLEKLPMARGGRWINSDKRGFYGASSGVKGRTERLKNLIKDEEEMFNSWLLFNNKLEIDAELIKRLLKLVYGESRLNTDPSLLQTFIIKYLHFKYEINSSVSPKLLISHGGPISQQNITFPARVL